MEDSSQKLAEGSQQTQIKELQLLLNSLRKVVVENWQMICEDRSERRTGRLEAERQRTGRKVSLRRRSSEEERRVDAKALIADEGRDKLRKAWGSCK